MFYMTHHDVGSRRKDCYDRFFFSPVVAAANDRIAILLNAHRTADVMENAFLLFYFWFLDEKKILEFYNRNNNNKHIACYFH